MSKIAYIIGFLIIILFIFDNLIYTDNNYKKCVDYCERTKTRCIIEEKYISKYNLEFINVPKERISYIYPIKNINHRMLIKEWNGKEPKKGSYTCYYDGTNINENCICISTISKILGLIIVITLIILLAIYMDNLGLRF